MQEHQNRHHAGQAAHTTTTFHHHHHHYHHTDHRHITTSPWQHMASTQLPNRHAIECWWPCSTQARVTCVQHKRPHLPVAKHLTWLAHYTHVCVHTCNHSLTTMKNAHCTHLVCISIQHNGKDKQKHMADTERGTNGHRQEYKQRPWHWKWRVDTDTKTGTSANRKQTLVQIEAPALGQRQKEKKTEARTQI